MGKKQIFFLNEELLSFEKKIVKSSLMLVNVQHQIINPNLLLLSLSSRCATDESQGQCIVTLARPSELGVTHSFKVLTLSYSLNPFFSLEINDFTIKTHCIFNIFYWKRGIFIRMTS